MVVLLRPIEQETTRQRPRLSLVKAASVPASLSALSQHAQQAETAVG